MILSSWFFPSTEDQTQVAECAQQVPLLAEPPHWPSLMSVCLFGGRVSYWDLSSSVRPEIYNTVCLHIPGITGAFHHALTFYMNPED